MRCLPHYHLNQSLHQFIFSKKAEFSLGWHNVTYHSRQFILIFIYLFMIKFNKRNLCFKNLRWSQRWQICVTLLRVTECLTVFQRKLLIKMGISSSLWCLHYKGSCGISIKFTGTQGCVVQHGLECGGLCFVVLIFSCTIPLEVKPRNTDYVTSNIYRYRCELRVVSNSS